jgi:hypothetical protein
MKNIFKVAAITAFFALGAQAQLVGVGYDVPLSQATVRIGMGANFIDAGLGDDAKFQLSASGFFLGHLHDWGPVDTYFTGGAIFAKTAAADDNIEFSLFGGLQPEITLLDHIVVSTRFGIHVPLMPAFILQTAGGGISIVEGVSFKILF